MLRSFAHKTEIIANIAIAIVALLIGVVVVKNYLLPHKPAADPAARADIKSGEKVALSDIDWSQADQTFLLVLSDGCHYCSESAPFYQQLIKRVNETPKSRIIAIFPQELGVGKKYLADHSLAIDDVRQADLNALKAKGTPTLILADSQGIAKKVWIGKLPANTESEVLSELAQNTATNCCN